MWLLAGLRVDTELWCVLRLVVMGRGAKVTTDRLLNLFFHKLTTAAFFSSTTIFDIADLIVFNLTSIGIVVLSEFHR